MKITFYGVRGSIPVSGPDTWKFGGDTSCVHIQLNNGTDVIMILTAQMLSWSTSNKRRYVYLRKKTFPRKGFVLDRAWSLRFE
jgi:hypothetical protein